MQDLQVLWELMGRLAIASAFMVVAFWFAVRRSWLAVGTVAAIFLIFLVISSPFIFGVDLAALVVLAAIWRLARIRPWKFVPAGLCVALLPYVIVAPPYIRRYHEMEAIRDLYPPLSIVDRLAYELRARPESAAAETTGPTDPGRVDETHPATIAAELERLEKSLNRSVWDKRTHALWGLDSLHAQLVHEFTEAEGFGRERAIWPDIQLRTIDIPEPGSLPASVGSPPASGEPTAANDDIAREDANAVGKPADEALRDMHEAGAIDFVNPRGFGAVVSRERVRGFQSHGFRSRPEVPQHAGHASRWRIVRLELVSLLKHATPVAYVSENLPRMQELAEAPTRALDRFEADALERLRRGEGLVVEREPDELRILGSLRAGFKCVECHTVKRGDLLGAFTYRLHRENPREPANVAKPTL